MGKDKREMNPAEAFRREQKKAMAKRNKESKKKVAEVRNLLNHPDLIQEKINILQKQSDENRLDKTLKDKIKEMKEMYDIALKKQQRGIPIQSSDKLKNEVDSSIHRKPEDSIYFDPVFNPTGHPPPGQKQVYKFDNHQVPMIPHHRPPILMGGINGIPLPPPLPPPIFPFQGMQYPLHPVFMEHNQQSLIPPPPPPLPIPTIEPKQHLNPMNQRTSYNQGSQNLQRQDFDPLDPQSKTYLSRPNDSTLTRQNQKPVESSIILESSPEYQFMMNLPLSKQQEYLNHLLNVQKFKEETMMNMEASQSENISDHSMSDKDSDSIDEDEIESDHEDEPLTTFNDTSLSIDVEALMRRRFETTASEEIKAQVPTVSAATENSIDNSHQSKPASALAMFGDYGDSDDEEEDSNIASDQKSVENSNPISQESSHHTSITAKEDNFIPPLEATTTVMKPIMKLDSTLTRFVPSSILRVNRCNSLNQKILDKRQPTLPLVYTIESSDNIEVSVDTDYEAFMKEINELNP